MVVLIQYAEERLHNVGGLFTLKPGNNEVDSEKWEKAQKIELVQYYLEAGLMTVIGEAKPGETLKTLKPLDAAKMVMKTFDVHLLRSWNKVEQRQSVQQAIKTQIDLILSQELQSKEGEGEQK